MAINSIDDLLSDEQEAQILQQARDYYTPSYNAAVNAANQGFANQQLSAQSAVENYELSAEKQKKSAEKSVINSAVKRGTGRGSRTDADMATAFADIADQVQAYKKQIGDQLLAAGQNKDATLAQLAADLETNVLNYAAQLRSEATQNAMWLAEFNRSNRGSGGGSSAAGIVDLTGTGSSGGSAGTVPTALGGNVALPQRTAVSRSGNSGLIAPNSQTPKPKKTVPWENTSRRQVPWQNMG